MKGLNKEIIQRCGGPVHDDPHEADMSLEIETEEE